MDQKTKEEFLNNFSFFAFCVLKFNEPIRDKELFSNLSFFNSSDLSFESNIFLFLVFG